RAEHSHVIGGDAIHAHARYLRSANDVTAPDDEPDADPGVDHILDLVGVAGDHIKIKTKALVTGERFTGQLQKNAAQLGIGQSSLLLAQLISCETTNLNVFAELGRRFLDQVADGLLWLAYVRLRHKCDFLVVRLDLALDHLLDDRVRLATGLGLLLEDSAFAVDQLLRDTALVDSHRGRAGDVQRYLSAEFLEIIRTGNEVGLTVDLHHNAHLAVVGHVARDQPRACPLAGALLGLADALLAETVDRLVQGAGHRFQPLLAFHHARAGTLPQSLDIFRCIHRWPSFGYCRCLSNERRRDDPRRRSRLVGRRYSAAGSAPLSPASPASPASPLSPPPSDGAASPSAPGTPLRRAAIAS